MPEISAAKMLEANPMLLQLRALQTMSENTGSTLIMNVGQELQTLPLQKSPAGGKSAGASITAETEQ